MKKNSLTEHKLLEISQAISIEHKIIELHSFNEEMTISQVVSFFKRNGYFFTKTMIQNYIRIGVLPPPVNKRNYTKNHLLLLALIYRLKTVFSLDEIKEVLMPILKQSDTFEDDLIKTEQLYHTYHSLHTKALNHWGKSLPEDIARVNHFLETEKIDITDGEHVGAFMMVLTLMTQMIATKELIDRITKEYLI